ncbi:hypothetical protein [[Micrococcus luteus] ATCC 49442]|uniref:hypothetical protein n=1 Tax=[Micrococcus luteus] ATCC 49442 TaxID=2698727 RepID=UPI0013DD042B|nr:hypothetical protein [[Micrococcus luteus] ATCC 49442]
MSTNFDLAPPPTTVDGLLATPIDIQHVEARLVFDAASSSGTGEATVDFTTGNREGNPVFDLRQQVTAGSLDGSPIPVVQLAHHDFGGGPDAELRIVESVLPARSQHTLRLEYRLGPPAASPVGSYPPGIIWSAGPRLAFNFGFTDLGAGRYLEAFIPANLIFDQFSLTIELQLLHTSVPHTPITNGLVTVVAPNRWRITFPAHFTALSPLLELRATDTLESATGTVDLPVSGTQVTIEAWKLVRSNISLPDRIADLKSWLATNEQSSGPYRHGSRFTAFLHRGGMEYEGGTTSGVPALRHEAFHSWFARGLKPASQPDAWWDEAWTVYNDNGATGSMPFNFSEPPVLLQPPNPWVRVTAPESYEQGSRFFEGVAAAIGTAELRAHMRDLYTNHSERPTTTKYLEEFLITRSGCRDLEAAFRRFVYGLATPVPGRGA